MPTVSLTIKLRINHNLRHSSKLIDTLYQRCDHCSKHQQNHRIEGWQLKQDPEQPGTKIRTSSATAASAAKDMRSSYGSKKLFITVISRALNDIVSTTRIEMILHTALWASCSDHKLDSKTVFE